LEEKFEKLNTNIIKLKVGKKRSRPN